MTDRGLAYCLEADEWGIIGAWIDTSNEPGDNVDLIVAAPDMLKALQGVVHHNSGLKDEYRISPALMRQVEAAIEKAT